MIYTVTLNPSLDYILDGSAIQLGEVNRVDSAQMTFGGKGISQSVVLTGLGIPNLAVGLSAGAFKSAECARRADRDRGGHPN